MSAQPISPVTFPFGAFDAFCETNGINLIHDVGLTAARIARLRSGREQVTDDTARDLAEAAGYTLADIWQHQPAAPVAAAPTSTTSGEELRWEDPPPENRGRFTTGRQQVRAAAILAQLQAHPGKFAHLGDSPSSAGPTVGTHLRKAGCKVVSRRVADVDGKKRFGMWACWPEGKKP